MASSNRSTEALIRTRFLTPNTPNSILGVGVENNQVQASLTELQQIVLASLAQQHKDFCLSTTFMEYLTQIQSAPGQ